jgi:hypothetical protein
VGIHFPIELILYVSAASLTSDIKLPNGRLDFSLPCCKMWLGTYYREAMPISVNFDEEASYQIIMMLGNI